MAVAETSLVKKNHQIATVVYQKIAQLLIEKQSMTDIAKRLAVSTSTVSRKLNEFQFKTDWNWLPENMSWDEYGFKKGKMSFIAQDFDSLKVITILDGRTQATIRNHFLRYSRQDRNALKSSLWTCLALITTSPENYSLTLRLSLIAFTLCNTLVVL